MLIGGIHVGFVGLVGMVRSCLWIDPLLFMVCYVVDFMCVCDLVGCTCWELCCEGLL